MKNELFKKLLVRQCIKKLTKFIPIDSDGRLGVKLPPSFCGQRITIHWLEIWLLPASNKFTIQNNPLMQLGLIFHQTGNKKKLKVWKFQSHSLNSFSAIKKTVTGMERRGSKFVLFLSLFLSANINFQDNLNSHKSLFIVTANLFSSTTISFLFSSAISLLYFP